MLEKNPLVPKEKIEKELAAEEKKEKREKLVSESIKQTDKYYNSSDKVLIHYESCGRLGNPDKLYFSDYSIKHVNDITLSRTDDLLENIITILNELKHVDDESADFCVSNFLLEEFLETLVGIKFQFVGKDHTFRWLCDCQAGIDPDDQIINEAIINLASLQYRSISDADEKLKEYVNKKLQTLTPEAFKNYLLNKYKDEPISSDMASWTIEQEIESLSIKEPISLKIGDDIYDFRLTRLKDILKAQKLSTKEFAGKIKSAQSQKYKEGSPLAEYKINKKKEVENLKYQQAKAGILYTKALGLVSINGEELSDKQKIEKYITIPRNIISEFALLLDNIQFGIYHEQEFTCPECGEVSKRSLQQGFNPIEFLPMESSSTGESSKHTEFNVYIGV